MAARLPVAASLADGTKSAASSSAPPRWPNCNSSPDPKLGSGTDDYSNAATCLTIASCASRVTTVGSPQGTKTVIDLNGYQAPRASKLTASLGLQVDGSLSPTMGRFGRVDYRYESRQDRPPTHFNDRGARNVVHLNAGIKTGNYRLTAYVRNATNDKFPMQPRPMA